MVCSVAYTMYGHNVLSTDVSLYINTHCCIKTVI